MITKKITSQKSRAQAMVEFAIALPVLLMLMYGILEAGRFLFIYSSVVTASRQAVRYGTATGSGGDFTADGGPDNSSYPRYQDCYGIRAAANRAGFLGQFDSIEMKYDAGPNVNPVPSLPDLCDGGQNFDTDLSPTNNNYRLVVTVSESFAPLIPSFANLVPGDGVITATSARTILFRVDIEVTAPAGGGGGTGDLTLDITPSSTSVTGLQTVNFVLRVTNGSTDLATPITISGFTSFDCSGEPATLLAGAVFDCTGTYTVAQTDFDTNGGGDGDIDISAAATVGGETSPSATATITISQSAALTLDKEGPVYAKSQNNTPVNYTYTLTNSGNVSLSPPYTVSDDKVANNDITCPSSGDIAPGASTICTGIYTLRQSDINAGSITNNATATATFGAQTITSNSDSWYVITPPVFLSVTALPASVTTVGETITYTYTLRNNINSNLTTPYTVTDSLVSNETCPGTPATLAPNDTVTCTGSYIVTQAHLDAGAPIITSTINASAVKATNPGAGNLLTSNQVTDFQVPVTQNPSLNLTVSAAPNPATVLNTVVTYTYTLTNSGNVTLSSPSITDDKAIAVCADTSPIAAGATRVCTGTRTISQTDLDDGSVISTATATTTLNAGTVSSNTVSTTVTTFVGARLTLVITANPNPVSGSGAIVTFTYTLRNTGNVVLSVPYSVASSLAGSADCSAASATIAVGGSTSCVGFYTTQPGDLGTSITDSATATAMDGAATVTSNNATLNVPVNP